jgi:hypothetical protein
MRAFRRRQARSDPPLVHPDAALQPGHQRAPGAGKPQAVGAAILAAPALDQIAPLELVQDTDQCGAIEPDGVGEPALRHPWIGINQKQHPGATRGDLGNGAREVAKYRLLRQAQPVAKQPGQHTGLEFIAAQFVWTPNNLIPS